MKIVIRIIALTLKAIILYFWLKLIKLNYEIDLELHDQNLIIVIFLFLPFAVGFERIINLILEALTNKKQQQSK